MRNSITAILLALAVASLTGCNSIEHHSEGAVVSAGETSHNYDALNNSLDSSIARLESLRKSPGSAENFIKALDDIDNAVAKTGDALKSSRQNLLEHGQDHVGLLREESGKFTDPDLSKKVAHDAEALNAQYAAYDKASASVTDSIELARKYADDIRRMMDINRSAAGVDNCVGTVRKIEDALDTAKHRIPAAKTALEDLRKQLPKPASMPAGA
jgi:DNA repair ATPase RecN